MIMMRTKSQQRLHIPSVEAQMMPAFHGFGKLWCCLPKIHWGHCQVVLSKDKAVVLVDVLSKLDAFIFLELPIHCQFHNLRLEVVMAQVLTYAKIVIFWRKIHCNDINRMSEVLFGPFG